MTPWLHKYEQRLGICESGHSGSVHHINVFLPDLMAEHDTTAADIRLKALNRDTDARSRLAYVLYPPRHLVCLVQLGEADRVQRVS
jgi:hypothetical protein